MSQSFLTLNLRDSVQKREKSQQYKNNVRQRNKASIKELLVQKLLKKLTANPANREIRTQNSIYIVKIVSTEVERFI
jgi:hypothetical protein